MNTQSLHPAAALLALLESRYALRMLVALRPARALTFRALQSAVGCMTPNTLNARLKEFTSTGLLEHTALGYRLTGSGMELAKRLDAATAFAMKWAQPGIEHAQLKKRPGLGSTTGAKQASMSGSKRSA